MNKRKVSCLIASVVIITFAFAIKPLFRSLLSHSISSGNNILSVMVSWWVHDFTIPDTVTKIGDGAFLACHFKSVNIPCSVTSIGNSAFRHCSEMKSVFIPPSVTNIGDDAFFGCVNLKPVVLPDSVLSLGDGVLAFVKA